MILQFFVDKSGFHGILNGLQMEHTYRGVEQLVARQAHNLEVVGSSPSSATILREIRDSFGQKDTGLDSSKNVKVMIFQPEEEYHEYSSSFLCQKIRCYYAVSAAELRPSTS